MSDNGLAALAAALEIVMRDSVARVGGPYAPLGSPEITIKFDRPAFAAAILGERGVFLPEGLDAALGNLTEEEIVAAFKSGYLVPRPPAEQAATIATLRAALEIIANATRTEPGEGYAISVSAHNIARHALATAKETP